MVVWFRAQDAVIHAREAIGYLVALPRTTINMGWYRDEE